MDILGYHIMESEIIGFGPLQIVNDPDPAMRSLYGTRRYEFDVFTRHGAPITIKSNSLTRDDGEKIHQWWLDAYRAMRTICVSIGIEKPGWLDNAINDIEIKRNQIVKTGQAAENF